MQTTASAALYFLPFVTVICLWVAWSDLARMKIPNYAVIALAILEHVYDPPAAAANFRAALRPGGRLFLYVPWMWRYHAPRSLVFQDYQRGCEVHRGHGPVRVAHS